MRRQYSLVLVLSLSLFCVFPLIFFNSLTYYNPHKQTQPFFELTNTSTDPNLALFSVSLTKMDNGCFSSPKRDFPAGLRVLVVDDDPTWLKILEKMLKKCNYEGWYVLSHDS